jgi:hypothetical protein
MNTRKYPHLKHKGWKHISDVNGLDLIDEESFKGEAYHGQKRKRRNK